jgi:hypothetical protein
VAQDQPALPVEGRSDLVWKRTLAVCLRALTMAVLFQPLILFLGLYPEKKDKNQNTFVTGLASITYPALHLLFEPPVIYQFVPVGLDTVTDL